MGEPLPILILCLAKSSKDILVSHCNPIGNLIISIRQDDNGIPGELISELSQWNYNLSPLNASGYNLITTNKRIDYALSAFLNKRKKSL